MQTLGFIVVAVGIIGFGVVSGRLERSVVTGPMAFVAIGVFVGPSALGLVHVDLEATWIHTLAELTLILVLFTDASRIDLGLLRRQHDLPIRMLLLGLPLTIVLGGLVALLLFEEIGLWQAAVLAAVLAPTDAALGQAVVSNPRVPVRIRQALNVESGLNDGIMLPVLLILLSVACATDSVHTIGYWVRITAAQVILGPLVGLAVGGLGGRLVELASRTGWMNHAFQRLSALGLALMAYGAAEQIGGNGFIAAFCAGLALGNFTRSITSCLYEFAEAEGQLLTLLIFTVFGIVMVPLALDHFSWTFLLYAALSLTVVRMVPVAISLIGARLQRETVLFCGWFGPRGIASILFGLLVLERSVLPGREELLVVVVVTVLLSVVVHGVTAYPASQAYARRMEATKEPMEEHSPVSEMPTARRMFRTGA